MGNLIIALASLTVAHSICPTPLDADRLDADSPWVPPDADPLLDVAHVLPGHRMTHKCKNMTLSQTS